LSRSAERHHRRANRQRPVTNQDAALVLRDTGETAQRQVTELLADDISISLRAKVTPITNATGADPGQLERQRQQAADWNTCAPAGVTGQPVA
jgi:hypothetical protein